MKKNKKVTIRYPDNKAVGDELSGGDRVLIAAKLGMNYHYVCHVLQGRRNSKKVMKEARIRLEQKENFLAK